VQGEDPGLFNEGGEGVLLFWKRTENGFTRNTSEAIMLTSPQEGGGG